MFITSRIALPNNQNEDKTARDTADALIYTDLTCYFVSPVVKPAKIGTNEIGSMATNINIVLSRKVSNILYVYNLNSFRVFFRENTRNHNKFHSISAIIFF